MVIKGKLITPEKYRVRNWIIKVIRSCKTMDQAKNCEALTYRFKKKYGRDDVLDTVLRQKKMLLV